MKTKASVTCPSCRCSDCQSVRTIRGYADDIYQCNQCKRVFTLQPAQDARQTHVKDNRQAKPL